MGEKPNRVVAQPVHAMKPDASKNRELWATVCFYYPCYTFQEASKLPARDIKTLIQTAKKLEAGRMYDLLQITTAPHTKKGKGVKQLSEHYKKIIRG